MPEQVFLISRPISVLTRARYRKSKGQKYVFVDAVSAIYEKFLGVCWTAFPPYLLKPIGVSEWIN